jgi:hypothetical protein
MMPAIADAKTGRWMKKLTTMHLCLCWNRTVHWYDEWVIAESTAENRQQR